MSLIETPSRSSKRRGIWRDPVLWFVLALGFFAYGAVYNFLPVSFPIFKSVFGFTLEQMGRSQSLFFISGLIFSACGGWLIGRLGLQRAAVVALLLVVIALIAIGHANGFSAVALGAFCFGLATMAVVVIISSIVSAHFGDKRQSVFFIVGLSDSSGAIVGPAALGWWLVHAEQSGGSWRTGYYIASGVVATLVFWAWILRPNKSQPEVTDSQADSSALSAMKDILRKPTIYAISLLGFLHGLAQGGMISFVGQLYQKKFQIDAAQAALFLSLNAAGFFAGRTLLSWITACWKIPELLVLTACGAGATLAFLATIMSPSYLLGLALFTLAGFFTSGNGPSLNSYVGMRFAAQTATAFAVFAGIGNVGAAAGPYLIGFVGNRFGVETGIWFVPLFSLLLALTAFGWFLHQKLRGQSLNS